MEWEEGVMSNQVFLQPMQSVSNRELTTSEQPLLSEQNTLGLNCIDGEASENDRIDSAFSSRGPSVDLNNGVADREEEKNLDTVVCFLRVLKS